MSLKKEPKLGDMVVNWFFRGTEPEITPVGHAVVLENALAAFTAAEAQMQTALITIQDEQETHLKAIKEAQDKHDAATESHAKLTRVLERVKAFTE